MEKRNVEVSVVIPVYNVYEWIDDCMESVINQTYTDFEVILVNDGSIDGSEEKCKEWEQKDGRVRMISIPHQGVQVCRNIGIRKAKGEYIAFIDADDWVELDYLQKLYEKICKTDADLVECDFWRYDNNTGKKTYRPSYGRMGVEYTQKERILYGESVVWKSISKKDLWIKNNIEIPNCLGAAHVVYVLFLILGAKVACIHEALYYYRRMRKGSILDVNGRNSKEENRMGLDELSSMIKELTKRNLYNSNRKLWEKAIKYRMSDLLAAQFARKDSVEFIKLYRNYSDFIECEFGKEFNNKYMNVSGYNLNRILSYLPEIHNPYCRFNFSSLISIVYPVNSFTDIAHSNKYRFKMIQRDIGSLFWEILKKVNPRYLFIDFIEERFDVIKVENGYITKSDAFDGLSGNNLDGRIMKNGSEEFEILWEKACSFFFEKVSQVVAFENIYIIENYLSEKAGNVNEQKYYNQLDEIRNINSRLKKKYQFVKNNFEGICTVKAYENELYFTDSEYEYGAVPQHLNEIVNKKIAGQIEEELIKNGEYSYR